VTKTLLLSLTVWLTLSSSTVFAQWFPHATRTRPVCSLSGRYDYSYNKIMNPVTVISFEGVLDTDSALTSGPVRVRSFPLRKKEITIDHCRISDVVVTIAESGDWTVDMLAEQNPKLLSNEMQPRIQIYHQNKFHITVRPLLGSQVVSPDSLDDVVAPTVSSLKVSPFWLEKGQMQHIHHAEYDPQLAARFDSIRLVAVDFQYE
jgi:hypothetical protein